MFSFKHLQQSQQAQQQADEAEITNKEEQNKFSQDDLTMEWIGMCNRMTGTMPALAARMKNTLPHITDYPNIELVVDNRQLLEQIEQVKGRIRKTMAIRLHNGNIDFTIRLAAAEEVKPLMSRKEVFDKMCKDNEAIEHLHQLLDLELS